MNNPTETDIAELLFYRAFGYPNALSRDEMDFVRTAFLRAYDDDTDRYFTEDGAYIHDYDFDEETNEIAEAMMECAREYKYDRPGLREAAIAFLTFK